MNIYLDIDGTLIHEGTATDQAAAGLTEFLVALRPHTTYWLTTHCRDGNSERARSILKRYLSPELHPDVDRIKPTVWDTLKTQGINWDNDFIWFDNDIYDAERALFSLARPTQQVIEVNLRDNPNQLIEIVNDIFSK